MKRAVIEVVWQFFLEDSGATWWISIRFHQLLIGLTFIPPLPPPPRPPPLPLPPPLQRPEVPQPVPRPPNQIL